jgi:outer membrane lipoprotein-sorting protein
MLFCGLLATPALWAEVNSLAILSKIDAQVSFMDSDFSTEIVMTQTKPGEGISKRTVALFRRDSEQKFVMLLLQPESDRGKGYLKIGNNLWLYETVPTRRFTVTSAKDRFQNSNARNSDFTRSTLALDYKIVSVGKEKLGPFDTTVYSLEALHNDLTFPKTKLWVTADSLVRKTEDYSLSGQLLRTTAMPSYQEFKGRFVPKKVTIIDALLGKTLNGVFKNETTEYTLSKLSTDPLPSLIFTQSYLEKNSQ